MHPNMATRFEAEGDKMEKAGFRNEVQFPIWLANLVPTKKKNG